MSEEMNKLPIKVVNITSPALNSKLGRYFIGQTGLLNFGTKYNAWGGIINPLPSSIDIIRDSIRTGMLPTIDSAKTLGIVSLQGMMTGLILAGTSPINAIRYQIMVTFMLLSTTAISSFMACYLSYRNFFNKRKQLT